MIGMIVSKQDRVDLAHPSVDELKSQLRWRVDEDSHSAARLYQSANARPLVTRISRSTHLAGAADLRDTKTGSRSQEREFQTVSTFRRLVVPGMSNGTPAVTMMRSPLSASSRLTTTVLVRSIISS